MHRARYASLAAVIALSTVQPAQAAAGATAVCDRSTLKIALDIGHSLSRPGATSARGVTEFAYNLALARRVRQGLQESGFNGAFLINEEGADLPLLRRPALARQGGAALFISLHHDSAQPQYFSSWQVDGRPRRYSDVFHGYSIFVSAGSPWARQSLGLAAALGRALQRQGLRPSLHHAERIPGEGRVLLDPALGIYRFDELAVLRGAAMPALLLESGVIVNRDEEAAIQSGAYHAKVAAALVAALTAYCEHPRAPAVQASRAPASPGR